MIPTSLPELPIPNRTPANCQKPMCHNPKSYTKNKNIKIIAILARTSIPGVWRSLVGIVFCAEFVFEIGNVKQILHPNAKIEKT